MGRAVLLRDGVVGVVREVSPLDRAELLALHEGLSSRTLYLRFFTESRYSSERYVTKLLRPSAPDHAGIVLSIHDRIVGVAAYEVSEPANSTLPSSTAEVAFVVADSEHGRGIGMLLLEHLASAARRAGVGQFIAETLPQNAAMLGVFRDAGYHLTLRSTRDDVQVIIDLKPGSGLLGALDRREREATRASLEPLFNPRSVAVVGASSAPENVGGAVVRNLTDAGFTGAVYPVNRRMASAPGTVHGWPASAHLSDVSGPIDLVVVAVPAAGVAKIVDECAALDVKAMVVLSAGFAEAGDDGVAFEADLLQRVRQAGIRLIGPNCLGIVSMGTGVPLAATFAPQLPAPGRVGVLSQSGGVGMALLGHTGRAGIGISTFVSAGNKADVSGNDLLAWWDDDPDTDIAVLYLESFGNPRKFARLARHVSLRKPIVAVKVGRRAAALFRQAGVISVDHIGELVDVVTLLSTQPLTAGPRLAVVGTTSGLNALAASAAAEFGLVVPGLTESVQEALRGILPAGAGVGNPVDVSPDADAGQWRAAIVALLEDPGIDALLAVVTPTFHTSLEAMNEVLAEAASGSPKPVLATAIGAHAEAEIIAVPGYRSVPNYRYPESAARALAHAWQYRRFRERPTGSVPVFPDIHTEVARTIAAEALRVAPEGSRLNPDETTQLLAAYGVAIGDRSALTSDAAGLEPIAIGIRGDQLFGPLITLGQAAEAFRLVPLTDVDAAELTGSSAVQVLLMRVAQLADDLPELTELKLDALLAAPDRVLVTGAAVWLAPTTPRIDPNVRQLR